MTVKIITILLFLFFISFNTYSQALSEQERKLYDMLMEYRKEKGLPRIPISASLTFVAQTHVKDLANNRPNNGICNAHSWSTNGKWRACCYTADHARAECMWSKPRELTNYQGNGYEIACWSSADIDANQALAEWKSSSGHNAVIINQGIWRDQWKAIGIGMYQGFAVVWFGKEFDRKNLN